MCFCVRACRFLVLRALAACDMRINTEQPRIKCPQQHCAYPLKHCARTHLPCGIHALRRHGIRIACASLALSLFLSSPHALLLPGVVLLSSLSPVFSSHFRLILPLCTVVFGAMQPFVAPIASAPSPLHSGVRSPKVELDHPNRGKKERGRANDDVREREIRGRRRIGPSQAKSQPGPQESTKSQGAKRKRRTGPWGQQQV